MSSSRLLAAVLFGGIVYYLALTRQTEAALGVLAFLVMPQAGWTETRLNNITNAMDFNFKRLRHLHRNPIG